MAVDAGNQLNAAVWNNYWIRISFNGLLEIGYGFDLTSTPFLTITQPDVNRIRHLGASSEESPSVLKEQTMQEIHL